MNVYEVLVLCLVFLYARGASIGKNNVCTNFKAYRNIQRDVHCYYNPDKDSTPSEIAASHGYILDSYKVTTEDGYVISIFRLKLKDGAKEPGQPVILQHGIVVDGLSWIVSGNNSLGFSLVSNGFDVWIPSFRGSTYSAKHINSSISEKDYWDFSFHELGIFDLPAIIEEVAKTTKRKDIVYIGHSMGATAGLVYATLKPEHAKTYIKGFIYMAPVAFFKNLKGLLSFALPFFDMVKNVFEYFKLYAIGTLPALQSLLTGITCGNYPMILICEIVYSFGTGLVVEQIRPDLLPVLLKYYPTGTSLKTLTHYVQIILTKGRFQWFDYGEKGNMERYNTSIPPIYDIQKIQMPTYIYASKEDFISEIGDSRNLYDHLKCPKGFHTYDLGHTDYIYGRNINKLYESIANVINTNLNNDNKII